MFTTYIALSKWPIQGDDDAQSESESPIDVEQDEAESKLAQLRKQAGVPELAPDGLPSTYATKVMNLQIYSARILFVGTNICFGKNCETLYISILLLKKPIILPSPFWGHAWTNGLASFKMHFRSWTPFQISHNFKKGPVLIKQVIVPNTFMFFNCSPGMQVHLLLQCTFLLASNIMQDAREDPICGGWADRYRQQGGSCLLRWCCGWFQQGARS